MSVVSSLSDNEVALYHQKGYSLYHQQLFSAQKMARLQTIFEEHLANRGQKQSDELDTPHFQDERLLEFLLSEEALDLVEPILGPNIGLWSSHFICKDPYTGRATPWHEDSAYWQDRISGMDKIVTIWLALDRSNRENGCMRVIPGSHLQNPFEHQKIETDHKIFDLVISGLDETSAVYFELEPGESSLHDARIIHGATANTSPYRRCGYTMRYFSTELKVTLAENSNFKVWLARGRDLAGNPFVNV